MDKGRYRRGSHTVTDFKYHFVRKTKYGHYMLKGDIALRLREIITEVCAQNKMDIISGNIRYDHIHILVRSPPYLSPAKMMQYLKGKSSCRLQREFPRLRKVYRGRHLRSRGCFAATVGAVTEERIKRYIESQDDAPESFKIRDETAKEDGQV